MQLKRRLQLEKRVQHTHRSVSALQCAKQPLCSTVPSTPFVSIGLWCADEISWNIRDRHMVATAEALRKHLQKRGIDNPRIVVCEP
jgi:erythromycin esterase-like protein